MITLRLNSQSYSGGSLSVDQILACSGPLSSCYGNGGWPEDALEYAAKMGAIQTESSYNGSCTGIEVWLIKTINVYHISFSRSIPK